MPDVFVSYRHSDELQVAIVADGLAQRGLDVWFDRTDIQLGDRWREEITDGIRNARSVVIVIGPTGIGGVQAFEVERALDRSVSDLDFPIIPVLLPNALRTGTHWDQLTPYSYLELDGTLDDGIVDRIADAVRGLDAKGKLDPDVAPSRTPYPGLRSFAQDEADLFFGRDGDIEAVLALCRSPGLAAVVGPSGLGKSSIVKAGVLPRLVTTPLDDVRSWRSVVVTPGHDPVRSLLVGIGSAASTQPIVTSALVDSCAEDPAVVLTQVMIVLQQLPYHTAFVLIVDQLEELFTKCEDTVGRRAFTDNLAHLADRCPNAVRLLVTLRSDFLTDLLQHPNLARVIAARTHLVGPLDDAGLRDAIQRPAWACGARLEARLVDEIVLDVRDQPNALPLLSVALHEMWTQRQGDRLTLRAYAEGGRVTGAIDDLAERAVEAFLPIHEPLIRNAVLRLIHLAPGSAPARRRRKIDELDVLHEDRTTIRAIVDSLARARLVVTDHDHVELAHDAVIVSWHRLADWVAAALGGDDDIRQQVEEAASNWVASGRSEHHLATAGLLARAEPLLSEGRLLLNGAEHEFLEQSRRAAHRGRRRRWLALASAGVAIVGIGVALVLLRENAAQRQENREAFAARLAAQAVREVEERPDLGLRLATLAFAESDLPATRSALLTTLTQPAQLVDLWAPGIDHTPSAATTVAGTDQLIIGTTRGDLWTCSTGDQVCELLAPAADNSSVTTVLGTTSGATAAVFDSGTVVAAPPGGAPQPMSTAMPVIVAGIDHDGGLLAVGLSDGSIELRNMTGGGAPIGKLAGRPSAVAVSLPLDRVVGARTNGFGFTVWSVDGTQIGDVATETIGLVKALEFDATGERLIVGDGSGDVLVFDTDALAPGADPEPEPLRLIGHDQPIVALRVDGDRLVSTDLAGEARQWDLGTLRPIGAPMGAAAPRGVPPTDVLAAGLSADRSTIIAVRNDAIVEWDALGRPALAQHVIEQDGIGAIAVDPETDTTMAITDAGTLVTLTANGSTSTVELGDVRDVTASAALSAGKLAIGGSGVAILDSSTGSSRVRRDDLEVTSLATPRTGDRIIAATTTGQVLVLSVTDLTTMAGPFTIGNGPLTDVAVSPDGSTVAAGRAEDAARTVAIVNVDTGAQRELAGHGSEVSSVAFNPDGTTLASGSDDRTIILWKTNDWQQQGVLTGHTDRVRRLTFDPTGDLLLSAGDDSTMRWWDVSERTPIGLPIRWDRDGVRDVRAGTAVAASLHGTAVVMWPIDPARWATDSCRITARDLTALERATFGGGRTLPAVCTGSAG